MVTGPLSIYVDDRKIRLLLNIPVGWPRLVYFHLLRPLTGMLLFDNETALLLYIMACDVLLYTLVTYFALLVFSFKRVTIKEHSPPPPPDVL